MKNLGKYVFEIIAIFIGISASFIVDEWREDAEKRNDLESNLKAIHYQLVRDSINSSKIIHYFDSVTVLFTEAFTDENYMFKTPEDWPVLSDNLIDLSVKTERNSKSYQTLIQFNLFQILGR